MGWVVWAFMVARVLFPLAPILEGHDHIPTAATIKAHTAALHPPSPLRMLMGLFLG